MDLIDVIKGRKDVTHQESEETDLAFNLIEEHINRKYEFRGLKKRYSGIRGEELLKKIKEEIGCSHIIYRYITSVKKYTDRKGQLQIEIKLIGKAGMRSRYNPFDMEMKIKTED